MKNVKILLASVLVFSCVFSVGAQRTYASSTEDEDTAQISAQVKENSSEIKLAGNPTTGYQWQHKTADNTIADVVNEKYVSDSADKNVCGAGGIYTWTVKGYKPGKTEITFNYLRPWETEILKSKTYVIDVDENLNVTVTEKAAVPAAVSKNGSIKLHGNASTGYTWQYVVSDNTIAQISNEDIVSDDPTGERDGAGETHTWTVKGLKAGSTEITFNYKRPWLDEVEESKTYVVNVDADLNVTVTEKAVETADPSEGDETPDVESDEATGVIDTDSTASDTDDSGITIYYRELKNGQVKEYSKKVSGEEAQGYFKEFSSYVENAIKEQKEQMDKFFDFMSSSFFM